MDGTVSIYKITLPSEQDSDAFVEFIKDKYLPAVRQEWTRVGVVTGVSVLRGVAVMTPADHEFVLIAKSIGAAPVPLIIEDDQVKGEFEGFGAKLEKMGAYRQFAEWDNPKEPD